MNEDQFVRYLKRQAREYVANLERMFGPCDEKFGGLYTILEVAAISP